MIKPKHVNTKFPSRSCCNTLLGLGQITAGSVASYWILVQNDESSYKTHSDSQKEPHSHREPSSSSKRASARRILSTTWKNHRQSWLALGEPQGNATHLEPQACRTLPGGGGRSSTWSLGHACSSSHSSREEKHQAVNHKGKIIPHSAEITSNWSLVCNPSSFLGVSQLPWTPPQDGSFSKATNAQFIGELEPGSRAVSLRSLKGLNTN